VLQFVQIETFSFVLVYHNLSMQQRRCACVDQVTRAFIDVFSESISFDLFGFWDFLFTVFKHFTTHTQTTTNE